MAPRFESFDPINVSLSIESFLCVFSLNIECILSIYRMYSHHNKRFLPIRSACRPFPLSAALFA